MTEQDRRPKTMDRLRADIDSGRTGEKVAGSDPAAAPFGTDAEAGGASPTRAEINLESRSRVADPPAPSPAQTRKPWLWAAALLLLLLICFAIYRAI